MDLKPILLAVVLLASPLTACTSSVVGEGERAGGGTDRESGFDGGRGDDGTMSSDGSSSSSAGASKYDPLFDAPADPTTTDDALHGLWAGTAYNTNDDLRLEMRSDKLTIAVRCLGRATVGLEVAAKVTPSSIRILASESGSGTTKINGCALEVRPATIPRCDETRDIGCFTLSGGTLSFEGVWLFELDGHGPNDDFMKLSD